MDDSKDTNPKDRIGSTKLPLHLVPSTAIALASLGHLEGAVKYGKWNWRVAGIRFSVYLDAAMRHLAALENGEDLDPDSGLPHEAHILACINIIVDARVCGKLVDDRPPRIEIRKYLNDLTPHVTKILEKYKDRDPHDYSIFDTEPEDK